MYVCVVSVSGVLCSVQVVLLHAGCLLAGWLAVLLLVCGTQQQPDQQSLLSTPAPSWSCRQCLLLLFPACHGVGGVATATIVQLERRCFNGCRYCCTRG